MAVKFVSWDHANNSYLTDFLRVICSFRIVSLQRLLNRAGIDEGSSFSDI